MTTAQYTPGPWHADSLGERAVFAGTKETNDLICLASCWSEVVNEETARANAHLMAAAPQMLNVLIAIRDRYNTDDRMGGLGDWINDTIKAARGEAVSA